MPSPLDLGNFSRVWIVACRDVSSVTLGCCCCCCMWDPLVSKQHPLLAEDKSPGCDHTVQPAASLASSGDSILEWVPCSGLVWQGLLQLQLMGLGLGRPTSYPASMPFSSSSHGNIWGVAGTVLSLPCFWRCEVCFHGNREGEGWSWSG